MEKKHVLYTKSKLKIMAEILEMRRKFGWKKELIYEDRLVKNSAYNAQQAAQYALQGMYYPIEEYEYQEVPRYIRKRYSHIEYRIRCEHCGGTNGWVRRRDARFCSANCRKLAYMKKS